MFGRPLSVLANFLVAQRRHDVKDFEICSGLKVNIDKTIAKVLGPESLPPNNLYGLTWTKDPIETLGVTLSGDEDEHYINTLRPRQNGRRFADDTSKRIFLNENVRNSITISLKFVPNGPINHNPALVQILAWRRSGGKPLSEPMMVSLLTHICVTRPQWVKLKKKRLKNTKNTLAMWICRNLSLEGKVTVINTLAISPLLYLANTTHVPPQEITEVKQIVVDFIWDGKPSIRSHIMFPYKV